MTRTLVSDIDSTLTDHWRRIRRCTVPRWPNGVIDSRAWTWEEIAKDALLPGAYDVLWELDRQGYEISYLTARNWDAGARISRRQLAHLRLPSPDAVEVVCTLNDKIARLAARQCTYYVDDFMTGQEHSVGSFHKDVATRIEASGVHVVVFRSDWFDVLEQIALYEER